MSLPADWTQVPVTGTFRFRNGDPLAGKRITFESDQVVAIDGEVIVPKRLQCVLDDDGAVPAGFTLPSTNDPDLSVTGWAYTVAEKWPGGRDYDIFVPYDSAGIDLATVSPAVDPDALVSIEAAAMATTVYAAATEAKDSAETAATTATTQAGIATTKAQEASDSADAAAASAANLAAATTIEAFGTPGAGANDNALFSAAIATGKPVLAFGPEYKLNQLVVTTPTTIIFGPNTVVTNVQASGTKRAAIRFTGSLTGSAVAITQFGAGDGSHTDSITVADASQFAAGDTVYIKENEALRAETELTSSTQDFNYWQFCTIQSVVGNVLKFDEFLRFPFDTVDAPTVQKVDFLSDCHVSGGIHKGGVASGGGVGFEFCRNSSAKGIKGLGNGESDRSGGAPVRFDNCWECVSDDTYGKWTTYGFHAIRNQSCIFDKLKGKRTVSAGLLCSGNIFCEFPAIDFDSPGDSNGDGITMSNGSRHNIIGSYTISGARCYGMWLHDSCDDNVFTVFKATAGITAAAYVYGDRNRFLDLSARGGPANGVYLYGNDNTVNIDFDQVGSGVVIPSTISTPPDGNRIFGRSISRGSVSTSRDVLINSNCTNTVIDIMGGSRGLAYGGTAVPQHGNDIVVRGPAPYTLRRALFSRGYRWSNLISSVNNVPQAFMVPGSGTNGLTQLVASSSSNATVYRITLKTNVTNADTYSEYLATTRQSGWLLTVIHEGSGTFAALAPKLTVNGAGIEISYADTSPRSVMALVEQF